MSAIKKLKAANWEIGLRIRKKAIERILDLKHPQKVFKYFAEVFIVFLIAAGIFVWFDPAINIIPAPLSYFFLAVVLVILVYIHLAFK